MTSNQLVNISITPHLPQKNEQDISTLCNEAIEH